ncbi:Listeria/Bacterioides repeat-containing protein [Butyrivibrio proteoclasticus]|uniref:Listeria/Bacterioides repeat-containing protein n=1 Tax=Butyrivibrio proteoclasticus TaxID=43305 RepID=A0A1I5TBR8_9FIRM|nr:hypothetical protein [Butyrivibrio proteoclasticus]SFP80428.1 Listeria/Bacterioides repeat-containing protein [Butyrivibrio proteoclasticus]
MDKRENNSYFLLFGKNKTTAATMLLIAVVCIFLLVFCCGIYIIFKPYTITMDLNDGTDTVLVENYNLNSGNINIGIPVREGYRFTGWTGSNGTKPQRKVMVGNGGLGDLSYKANWTNKLHVSCQDWLVDAEGNLIKEITSEVDKFLKDGKSNKKYKVQERTIEVKAGEKINATKWGSDKSYKAYSDKYMYIGSSGDIKLKDDETIVYRYFYPVLDVNYLLDDKKPSQLEIADSTIARFDLYVDGKRAAKDVSDYCKAVPYGSEYEIVIKAVNPEYEYVETGTDAGLMPDSRNNIDISFITRQGELEVNCEDWIIDSEGKKIAEITDQIDSYLKSGKSSQKYVLQSRTMLLNEGDVVSGADWGADESVGAYHSSYVYVGASEQVRVKNKKTTVYRFFYPVLKIGAEYNGKTKDNSKGIARFNVHVDGEIVAENVTAFKRGIPYNSSYRVEICGYDDYSYVYKSGYSDEGKMGKYGRTTYLSFIQRIGDGYVILEDWLVDADDNRIREITDEVDNYLLGSENLGNHKQKKRIIPAYIGTTIDASLFGNDEAYKAYHTDYVYAGSSGNVEVSEAGTKIYRYFYPVLDVNAEINDKSKVNANKVATFSVFVNGKAVRLWTSDYCAGVPCGAAYEIRQIHTMNGYEYIDDGSSVGQMGDERTQISLKFEKTKN